MLFLAIAASAQLTVDETAPAKRRQREPTAGTGGGVGRKLSILVSIETHRSSPDENGGSLVEFVLTNSGKEDLSLPVSPNPADFEPADARRSYKVKVLNLYVTYDKPEANSLDGRATLYGNDSMPGTMVKLAPAESIRVLARVTFPSSTSAPNVPFVLVAHAILESETVRPIKGEVFSRSQEVGSSSSPEYSLSDLLGSRN